MFQNKTYKILKARVLIACFKYLESLTCDYWNMNFEWELNTLTETSAFKCILTLYKSSQCRFCYDEKLKKSLFSANCKNITQLNTCSKK